MKALTLWQPYASLLMAGAKCMETRSWAWHLAAQGTRIAIHSALRFHPGARDKCADGHFARCLRELADDGLATSGTSGSATARALAALPLGKVLGSVELVRCVRTPDEALADAAFVRGLLDEEYPELGTHSLAQELAFGDFGRERWAWVVKNREVLARPIPVRGHQKLWSLPTRLETALATVQAHSAGPAP